MPDSHFSLMNLETISNPQTKLIETVSSSLGLTYVPGKSRNRSKIITSAQIDCGDKELKSVKLTERADRRIMNLELRRQQNIELIIEKAGSVLQDKVSDKPVSPDWIAYFFSACQDVRDDKVQRLWARILAGEVVKPGSYSRRTIETLRVIDHTDACLFELICNYVMSWDSENLRFIPSTIATNSYIASKGLAVDRFSHLIKMGFLQDGLIKNLEDGQTINLEYIDRTYVLENPKSTNLLGYKSILIWNLTDVGCEIYQLCDHNLDKGYISSLANGLEEKGLKLHVSLPAEN